MSKKGFPEDLYAHLFGPDSSGVDRQELSNAATAFCQQATNEIGSLLAERVRLGRKGPINILSVGYGMGRIDLPLIVSLQRAFASSASTSRFHAAVDANRLTVTALEPNWRDVSTQEQSRAWFREFGFESNSATADAFMSADGLTEVQLVHETLESFLSRNANCPPENNWDVIIVLFTLHLLDDWKCSIGKLLSSMQSCGLLIASEATGQLAVVDGLVLAPNLVSPIHRPWVDAWFEYHSRRDRMHFPRVKINSPRSLEFLAMALRRSGFAKPVENICEWEREVDRNKLIELFCKSADGPLAGMRSIRGPDWTRGRRLAEWCESSDSSIRKALISPRIHYSFGMKLIGWVIRSSEVRDREGFLAEVGKLASEVSHEFAADTSSRLKAALIEASRRPIPGDNDEDDPQRTRRERALACLVTDMRESMALSQDAMVTLASRDGRRYSTVVNLIPGSLVALPARHLISRMVVHSHLVDTSRHFSSLVDLPPSSQIVDHAPTVRWTNFVFIVRLVKGTSSVRFIRNANGQVLGMLVAIPEPSMKGFLQQAALALAPLGNQHYSQALRSCFWQIKDDWSLDSTYLTPRRDTRLTPGKYPDLEVASACVDKIALRFAETEDEGKESLLSQLKSEVAVQGWSEEEPQIKSLVDFFGGLYRHFLINSNANLDTPSFRSIVFIGHPTPLPDKLMRWSELLFHLSDSDTFAFLGPEDACPEVGCLRILGAITPFVTAIHEIEVAEYSWEAGMTKGEGNVWAQTAHEGKKIVQAYTQSVGIRTSVKWLASNGKNPEVYLPSRWKNISSLNGGGEVMLVLEPSFLDRAGQQIKLLLSPVANLTTIDSRQNIYSSTEMLQMVCSRFDLVRELSMFSNIKDFLRADRGLIEELPKLQVLGEIWSRLFAFQVTTTGHAFNLPGSANQILQKVLFIILTDAVKYAKFTESPSSTLPLIEIVCEVTAELGGLNIKIINDRSTLVSEAEKAELNHRACFEDYRIEVAVRSAISTSWLANVLCETAIAQICKEIQRSYITSFRDRHIGGDHRGLGMRARSPKTGDVLDMLRNEARGCGLYFEFMHEPVDSKFVSTIAIGEANV